MSLHVRAAVVQLQSGADLGRNLASTRRHVSAAAANGVQLVALPDSFAYVGSLRGKLALAEELENPGPILTTMAELARRNRIYLVGTVLTRAASATRARNTAVLYEPGGTLAASYHKAHLRAASAEDEIAYLEPGNQVVTTRVLGTRLGLAVSDDLRSPDLFRHLAGRGASVCAAPANMPSEVAHRHWQMLVRARAVEAACFVVAAAQASIGPRGDLPAGGSCIVDPFGEVLAEIPTGEGFACAELRLERVEEARQAMKLLRVERARSWRPNAAS